MGTPSQGAQSCYHLRASVGKVAGVLSQEVLPSEEKWNWKPTLKKKNKTKQSVCFSVGWLRCVGDLRPNLVTIHPLVSEGNSYQGCETTNMAACLSLWGLHSKEVQSCYWPESTGHGVGRWLESQISWFYPATSRGKA